MPIRFRCAYCNQLMGIARRKGGTIVRCPKCDGQVVVPVPENEFGEGAEQIPPGIFHPQADAGKGGLFEQSDFEKVFEEGHAVGSPQVLHPPVVSGAAQGTMRSSKPSPGSAEYDAVPLDSLKNPKRGVFIPSGVLAVGSGLVIVLMGMAFFLGLLLGRSSVP